MAKKASKRPPAKAARRRKSPTTTRRAAAETKSMNRSLHAARATKQDEFYTQLSDIEKELKHYTQPDGGHFKGKTVLCNCDDPKVSNFFRYFANKFRDLGLKRLITTCYRNANPDLFSQNESGRGMRLIYSGELTPGGRVPGFTKLDKQMLNGDGDFRSAECIELLKEADIVVTNPPFSLFREYVGQLVAHKKKFLIIGNMNAVTYKEVFSLIRDAQLWFGASIHSGDREFGVPDHYPLNAAGFRVDEMGRKFIRVKGVRWYTNLDYAERHEDLVLYNKFSKDRYPEYDRYKAINVDATKDIPVDYRGVMGVPISFLDKFNPEQFEIVDANTIRRDNAVPVKAHGLIKDKDSAISGKPVYVRVPIRHKRI